MLKLLVQLLNFNLIWEYGHYYNNLWAERFIFDNDSVEIAIGS